MALPSQMYGTNSEFECFYWCRLLDGRTIKESDTNRPRLSFDGSGAKGGLIPALLHDA